MFIPIGHPVEEKHTTSKAVKSGETNGFLSNSLDHGKELINLSAFSTRVLNFFVFSLSVIATHP